MLPKIACLSLGLASIVVGAIDNSVWVAICGALGIGLVAVQTIVVNISNNRTRRIELKQSAESAKRDKEAALVDKKLNVIHSLTNSAMTEQKRVGAISARTLAITTKNPAHIALADEAERNYQEALKAQPPK